MQEKALELAGGSLYYEINHNAITITRLQGSSSEVSIPAEVEGLPVRELAKKAFLSKKALRRVILPETLEVIGDWAFAYCDGLETVTLPGHDISFGKAVFLDCVGLKRLEIMGKDDAVAALLAAAVTTVKAEYLLNIREAGSEEWLAKWDARMLELLGRPDREGFSRQVLCGEEDYGSTDLEAFMQEKRREKVRLLLLRCLHSLGLSWENRYKLEGYLLAHTKGCATEETWQVIWKEHGEDSSYYRLFVELGCLTEQNFEGILKDIGEDYPEMKAFFLRYKEEKIGYEDFFENLEL